MCGRLLWYGGAEIFVLLLRRLSSHLFFSLVARLAATKNDSRATECPQLVKTTTMPTRMPETYVGGAPWAGRQAQQQEHSTKPNNTSSISSSNSSYDVDGDDNRQTER